jgi:putative ABC transport system permease protein
MVVNQAQKNKALWKVAWKLAFRQVQRASMWMNGLIVLIMVLTFLNLVVITGILTGLMQGSFNDNRIQYTGDIFINALSGENGVGNTHEVRETLKSHPDVARFTERYLQSVTMEANYQDRWDFDSPENSVSATLVGFDPDIEDSVTGLSSYIAEGEYLDSLESGYVLVGSNNLAEYTDFSDVFDPLVGVKPGDRIKLTYNAGEEEENDSIGGNPGNTGNEAVNRSGVSIELTVKGIVDTKVGQISGRVFITKEDWKRLVGQKVEEADEFAVRVKDGVNPDVVISDLRLYGLDKEAKIESAVDAMPSTLANLQITFGLLGNVMGAVAVIVSCITVFVVIYINALTRRKQIGILKGIGIKGRAIEIAYIIQSLFYAVIGSAIGYAIVFFLLVPYFDANPIDFPFSDGILAVTVDGTFIRAMVLVAVTAVAGYIPSWLIVRQNTLDSILGR